MTSIKKKFIIISGYFSKESYGLLGPQMAGTIIKENTPYDCIVVAVTNEFIKDELKKTLNLYFGKTKPIIGFSTLGGRMDLVEFAKELKNEGAITILAGPQAGVDFKGEIDNDIFSHRFQGFSNSFDFAIQGPAEQIIPFLNCDIDKIDFDNLTFDYPGFLYKKKSGEIQSYSPISFNSQYLSRVFWNNIFIFKDTSLKPLNVSSAQILQQIGCPHASVIKQTSLDYPESIQKKCAPIKIDQKGCSFCDVASDKGYLGNINDKCVKEQLMQLPEQNNSKKIPFELINENPIPKLDMLIDFSSSLNIKLSQINLTLRADHLIKCFEKFKIFLKKAETKKIKILISSIGFESFDDTILKNLNKGVTARINIEAIKKLRILEYEFHGTLYYTREHGSNHGFIHPTPWDNSETQNNTNTYVSRYNLANDILPSHSTPLIIHHASTLGDWARSIELNQGIKFSRHGSTIGWWEIDGKLII
jgi:hypothetical protein